jgi:hypothetical protein
MENVPGSGQFVGSQVNPSGKYILGEEPDALGQHQMALFEIDRGTTRFVEHPDGGHYGAAISSPGWLDDHRVLFWSRRDEKAVVFDVRDDSITPVPDLPPAGYGFNAATGTMLLIEWTREADVWLLRFGGG